MKTFSRHILPSLILIALACSGCSDTQQASAPPQATSARVVARPKSTPTPKPTPTRAEKRRQERRRLRAERKARREKAKAEELAKAEARANAAFDVPALLGQSIEQVHDTLGPVEDSGPEDDDGEMSWTKRKGGLLVHYDQTSRETTEFFVNQIYGEPLPQKQLLAMANVREGDPRYTLEFVPAFGSEPKCMGVKIIPN